MILLLSFTPATALAAPATEDPLINIPAIRQIDNNGAMMDPAILNAPEGRYTFVLTPKEDANQVYVAIPAAILAGLRIENPNFLINIEAPFASYSMPAAIETVLAGFENDDINLRRNSLRITLQDRSADKALAGSFAKSLPHATAISPLVEIRLELIDSDSHEVLLTIGDLAIETAQWLPVDGSEFPRYYGVFRYDEIAESFSYVPHKAAYFDDLPYAEVALAGSGLYVVAQNQVPFKDLPVNAWYSGSVLKAAAKLLVRGGGDNNFEPQRFVTRAEFTQMIANALLLPQANSAPYMDVAVNQWYAEAIARAYGKGLLERFTDKNFLPVKPITREEMAVILGSVLRICGFTSSAALSHFTDVADMNSDYRQDIALVFEAGLMQGVSYDKFDPKGVTTRAQAATVQIRLLEILNMIDK
ncbi:MAG: S-layer homology domain-containing protein [Clostridiales bacterium]|nr:S-layer homology domain-containing protein [Clostridiales bacterium]